MKILFIFTGGTIGSTEEQGVISARVGKAYSIIAAYEKKYGIDFEYDIKEPYTEVSENNTGHHIKTLCACVKESLSQTYDGIIITHGSDTLQYSAAALSYCLGLDTPLVCLVAANAPIEKDSSNALDNLRGAVLFIRTGTGRGVFAVYRNAASHRIRVHRGTRLIGPKAYSDDLSSAKKSIFGEFDRELNFIKSPDHREYPDAIEPFDPKVLSENNNSALMLFSYPAMRYPEIGEGVRYVIFNTYHSGTLNTGSDAAKRFFTEARERGIPVYATGISTGARYSSALLFEELGITPVYELSPVAAYVKLWLAYASGSDPLKILSSSLSGDIIPPSDEDSDVK